MDNEIMNAETINEENARKVEIKKEDDKKVGLFILITGVSGIVGGALGVMGVFLVDYLKESGLTFMEIWNETQKSFSIPSSVLLILLDVSLLLISFLYLCKAKKLWKSDLEEEKKYGAVEKKLSMSILLTNVTYFLNFAFFGFTFYATMSIAEEVSGERIRVYMRIIALLVFMATLFINLAIQKACINHIKLMNPEKNGSVYDMKFDKVWYASCDEAERMQIGIASYKAVKATNAALIYLLVVFVTGGMFFEIGILPIVIITVIALVINITYGIESMKLGSDCGSGRVS